MCQNYWFFNLINDTKPVQCRARARAGPSDKVRPSTYSKNNVFLTNVFWRVGAFTIYNAGKKQKLKIHVILRDNTKSFKFRILNDKELNLKNICETQVSVKYIYVHHTALICCHYGVLFSNISLVFEKRSLFPY